MKPDNIRELRGRIPQTLKIAFEIACARLEISQSEALDQAVTEWLIKHDLPTAEQPIDRTINQSPPNS